MLFNTLKTKDPIKIYKNPGIHNFLFYFMQYKTFKCCLFLKCHQAFETNIYLGDNSYKDIQNEVTFLEDI